MGGEAKRRKQLGLMPEKDDKTRLQRHTQHQLERNAIEAAKAIAGLPNRSPDAPKLVAGAAACRGLNDLNRAKRAEEQRQLEDRIRRRLGAK